LPALQNPINYRLTSSQCQITYDGNGRIARLLSTLMALQAGLPLLDFSSIAGAERKNYFAAVQAGIDRNYAPMCAIFAQIISATPAARK
jgi:hypothetical protein